MMFSRTERVYFTLIEMLGAEEVDTEVLEIILADLTPEETEEFDLYICQLKAMYGVE